MTIQQLYGGSEGGKTSRRMTDTQLKRIASFQPSVYKKRGRKKQCSVCGYWVHPKMETCQPCGGAQPIYSKQHKF